ncbi:MAG: hypothetical protein ABR529_04915 [Actinomycetota bacterium]
MNLLRSCSQGVSNRKNNRSGEVVVLFGRPRWGTAAPAPVPGPRLAPADVAEERGHAEVERIPLADLERGRGQQP